MYVDVQIGWLRLGRVCIWITFTRSGKTWIPTIHPPHLVVEYHYSNWLLLSARLLTTFHTPQSLKKHLNCLNIWMLIQLFFYFSLRLTTANSRSTPLVYKYPRMGLTEFEELVLLANRVYVISQFHLLKLLLKSMQKQLSKTYLQNSRNTKPYLMSNYKSRWEKWLMSEHHRPQIVSKCNEGIRHNV